MEIKLNKNGWHRQLQVYVFGDEVIQFGSLCPYFWLTVFCLVVAPFVFLVSNGVKTFNCFAGLVDKYLIYPLIERKAVTLTDEELLEMYSMSAINDRWDRHQIIVAKMGRLFDIRRKKGLLKDGTNEETFDSLRKKYYVWQEAYIAREAARAAAANKKRDAVNQRVIAVVKYTKLTAHVLGAAAIAAGLYGVYRFLTWMTLDKWANFGIGLLVVIGLITVVVLAFLLSSYIGDANWFRRGIRKVFHSIGSVASHVVAFIAMIFTVIKENYCPLIQWDKEDNG